MLLPYQVSSAVGQRRFQLHLPTFLHCSLQPHTNMCLYLAVLQEPVSRPTFSPCASTTKPFSETRVATKQQFQECKLLSPRQKTTHRMTPMNHSRTGESTYCFYHHLLLLETDRITAWSALGPEDWNYKLKLLIIR